jgi:hypothetical protein
MNDLNILRTVEDLAFELAFDHLMYDPAASKQALLDRATDLVADRLEAARDQLYLMVPTEESGAIEGRIAVAVFNFGITQLTGSRSSWYADAIERAVDRAWEDGQYVHRRDNWVDKAVESLGFNNQTNLVGLKTGEVADALLEAYEAGKNDA